MEIVVVKRATFRSGYASITVIGITRANPPAIPANQRPVLPGQVYQGAESACSIASSRTRPMSSQALPAVSIRAPASPDSDGSLLSLERMSSSSEMPLAKAFNYVFVGNWEVGLSFCRQKELVVPESSCWESVSKSTVSIELRPYNMSANLFVSWPRTHHRRYHWARGIVEAVWSEPTGRCTDAES